MCGWIMTPTPPLKLNSCGGVKKRQGPSNKGHRSPFTKKINSKNSQKILTEEKRKNPVGKKTPPQIEYLRINLSSP